MDQAKLQKLQSLNTIGTISYVLHLIVAVGAVIPGGQFGPVLLVAALVLDMLKRDDAKGTWHASHFRWRIRTVITAGVLYLVTAPLWMLFLFPGWVAWTAISIWFLYRIVMGFMAMNKGQAMEASA
ncbi:MAG: hypothetical protein A3F78_18125 [Burkholderiales bacterium RIFCSPLOWO2_12_FULL_61_40]|nr:MAG: hypothetical protein A3F78_18125 [Burkholderiales bacterium RIFCSPLOWO2_12_FULL_61_40]